MCRTERLCLKPFMPGSSARTPGGDRSAGGWALKSSTFLIPGDGWVKIILNQTRLPPQGAEDPPINIISGAGARGGRRTLFSVLFPGVATLVDFL